MNDLKTALQARLRAISWSANRKTLVPSEQPPLEQLWHLISNGQFEEVLRLVDPNTKAFHGHKALGLAHMGLGNFAEALQQFNQAVFAIIREEAGIYLNQASVFKSMKAYDQALECAQKCIEISEDWYPGYLMKIAILENRDSKGDQEQVSEILKRIKSDHPEFFSDTEFLSYLENDIDYSRLRTRENFDIQINQSTGEEQL